MWALINFTTFFIHYLPLAQPYFRIARVMEKNTEKFSLVLSFKSFFCWSYFFIQCKSMSVRDGLTSIAPLIFRLRIHRKNTHNKHLENTRKKRRRNRKAWKIRIINWRSGSLLSFSLYRSHALSLSLCIVPTFSLFTIQHFRECFVVTAIESANTVFSFRFVIERNEHTIGY